MKILLVYTIIFLLCLIGCIIASNEFNEFNLFAAYVLTITITGFYGTIICGAIGLFDEK